MIEKKKMNNFCRGLTDALCSEFDIDMDVFVSKKKKIVHLSLYKPLISYSYFKDIIRFIQTYWKERKHFFSSYLLQYPLLNQSVKWRFDYIIAATKNIDNKRNKMDALLDRFYEDIENALRNKFREYIIKVSQLNCSFFVLIKRPRGKILGEKRKYLYENLKEITENIYRKYASDSSDFERQYFPYLKLIKCYGNYHYHFLVAKKDYFNYGGSNKTLGI